jgi:hypothetical protein
MRAARVRNPEMIAPFGARFGPLGKAGVTKRRAKKESFAKASGWALGELRVPLVVA